MFNRITNYLLPTTANDYRPYLLNERFISLYIVIFLIAKVFFYSGLSYLRQTPFFANVSAKNIIALTNDFRRQYGLPEFQENQLLQKAAEEKAKDMELNKYFGHYSPSGLSPWYWIEKIGYPYYYAGENLAINFVYSEDIVRAWLNSPAHRDNILNKNYQEIGVAVISGDFDGTGKNKIAVVQMFGTKIPSQEVKVALQQKIPVKEVSPKLTSEELQEKILPQAINESQIEPSEIKKSDIKPEVDSKIVNFEKIVETATPVIISKITKRDLAEKVDRFFAANFIFIGLITALGVISVSHPDKRKLFPLLGRSFVVFAIGLAFWFFQLEMFLGKLIIG